MSDPTAYVMGHTDRERRRLVLQASVLGPLTDQLFRRAGIAPGMHVLDIGCGVGDVSLLAAGLVGSHGSVTSVDFDAAALQTLEQRAAALGVTNISCLQADVQDWTPPRRFDAVVGRHILIHVKDPLAMLKRCRAMLHPRGLGVFHEYDFSVVHRGWPPTPLRDRVFDVFDRFFAQATRSDMGSRLWNLMIEAGFEHPDCRAEYPIGGGADSFYYEWLAESLRSLLPRATQLGIVRNGEIEIDALEKQLRQEAAASNSCCPAPAMVGAFARLSAADR